MSNVVPIRRCRCGAPAEPRLLVCVPTDEQIAFNSCEKCIVESLNDLERERVIFEALLKLGVSREIANVMMMAKHNHEAADNQSDGT